MQVKLKRLASRYNVRLIRSDRKFYKKYNYKFSFRLIGDAVHWRYSPEPIMFDEDNNQLTPVNPAMPNWKFNPSNTFHAVQVMREFAYFHGDQIRAERKNIQYYSNNLNNIESMVDSLTKDSILLGEVRWFPGDIDHKVRLRKTPQRYPYELILRGGVNVNEITKFYNNYKDNIWLDKNTKLNLELFTDHSKMLLNYSSCTWGYSNFRFDSEDLKNMFLLTFGQHIKEEIFYQHQPLEESTQ